MRPCNASQSSTTRLTWKMVHRSLDCGDSLSQLLSACQPGASEKEQCKLTIVTSSIFEMLLTSVLTFTIVGPSLPEVSRLR